ncbi:deoxyribonuclease-1-like isoform X2 [Thalassophryne amazonica]|uniref:deoxyribonuclease-1-like isoform X2 n=1 Tax=Thalassophryne amazonica TaxID=390379 RepID=UPI001471927F|nr:deoxyribonuclease-1-like isoform X2 [Thalassophryne amazonica]
MKIASFNAKNFGEKKVKDKNVMKYFIEIISRYDVIVMQEVMDKNNKVMGQVLKKLNDTRCNRDRPFSLTSSSRLGRDTYKEQYVCLYRECEAALVDQHQYEDEQVGDEDVFEREPFSLLFRCPAAVVKDFVLITVHTKPKDTLEELEELNDVVDNVKENFGTNNIMIIGDFNADGRYISLKKLNKLPIRHPPYHWLIGDDIDTTSSNLNDHTYDRIVVYGDAMLKAVVPNSAKPFNFQEEFDLSDEMVRHISDHYPVEVELKTPKTTAARGKGPQKKKPKGKPPKTQNVMGQKKGTKRRRLEN